jgi:hypothetical protein
MNTQWSGGTRRNWISELAKSEPVEKVMKNKTTAIKRDADRKVNALRQKDWKYHFGMTRLGGSWGTTAIIWPTNRMAVKDDVALKNAIAATEFKKKGSA